MSGDPAASPKRLRLARRRAPRSVAFRFVRRSLALLLAVLSGSAREAGASISAECPPMCVCYWGVDPMLQRRAQIVTCSALSAFEPSLVAQLAPHVELLRVVNGSTRVVDFRLLQGVRSLVGLDLHSCGVQDVTGTGRHQPELRFLDMSGNRLHTLKSHSFSDFPELQFLNVSRNDLHTIMPFAFKLSVLKTLDLRYNKITSLQAHFFEHLPSLDTVYLAHNSISTVPGRIFNSNMKIVDLSHNQLIYLEESSFYGVNVTEELNLAYNRLRNIPSGALKHMRHLYRLVLDGNSFTRLSKGAAVGIPVHSISISNEPHLIIVNRLALHDLNHLEELEIHDNPLLSYIHPQSLSNVPRLKKLDISNNSLFTLEANLLLYASSISEVYAANNNFACHCSLMWLEDLSDDDIYCTDKDKNALVPFSSVKHNDHGCPPYIVPIFPESTHHVIGSNATFQCHAIGSSDIVIYWYSKSGERLFNGQCSNRFCVFDNILTIYYLHRQDSGPYSCVARNSAGSTTRVVYLEVRSLNVHLSAVTIKSTLVTLSWNMSTPASNNYILRYGEASKERNSTPESYSFTAGSKTNSYTVHGLKPGTVYLFSICVQRENYVIVLSTTSAKTLTSDLLRSLNIEKSYMIAIMVSVMIGVIVASVAAICSLRCYRQRVLMLQRLQEKQNVETGCTGKALLQSAAADQGTQQHEYVTYITLAPDGLLSDENVEDGITSYA